MPPERTTTRRQDPVSCQNCRRKKLRCDRSLPCANCTTRDVPCEYSAQRPAVYAASQPAATGGSDVVDLRSENATIKARLQMLEELVLSQRSDYGRPSPATSSATTVKSPVKTVPHNISESEKVTTWTGDSQWLEGIGVELNSRTPQLINPVNIRIQSLHEIIRTELPLSPTARSRCISVPTLDEATVLLQFYLRRSDTLQNIIHFQSVDAMLRRFSGQLSQGQPYKLSEAALIISIIASAAESWSFGGQDRLLFSSPRVAVDIATYWLKGALDIMDLAWRSQTPDLATVQAAMILLFLLYHTEAFSPKVRFLQASAITLAKEIKLHLTDAIDNDLEIQQTREQIVDRELRRRVWWHLTATDWSISLYGGPHEGTYNVNPRHIRVRKPRNISNEELSSMPVDFEHPMSEMTPMTYYLWCIRVGEVCREVADTTWELRGVDVDDEKYRSYIVPMDKKFDELLGQLPPFLRVDYIDDANQPSSTLLKSQRYFITLTIQARRCRMHIPYLLRASHNQSYEYSRMACIRAARSMLRLRDCVPNSRKDSVAVEVSGRLVGLLHHFFHAVVVLVMDLCVNRSFGSQEERKAEIQSACTIFEDARQYATSAGLFLDTLLAVMHKHKVRLQTQDAGVTNGTAAPSAPTVNMASKVQSSTVQPNADPNAIPMNEWYPDNWWQSWVDMNADVDPREWDAIFATLDTTLQ